MIATTLADAAAMTGGSLRGDDAPFSGICSDTRVLEPGQLFVALSGPRFDGHDYLEAAAARGAAGAVVARHRGGSLPCIEVDDPLSGLGRLGHAWRGRAAAQVVGITGSNGKTTLKEMLAAILARTGQVMATRGNLNNAIGVPLTLCRLGDESHAVIEMGANHAGEIDYLTRLVNPDVAVLNNAGRAHLEGFGSLEGVARAKAEILNGLGPDGVFVFNADDRFADLWRELAAGVRRRTFGVHQPADVSSPPDSYHIVWGDADFEARFALRSPAGEIDVCLHLVGEHNRMNALAATAAALLVDATLDDVGNGLGSLQPVPGRLFPVAGANGARIVDDSYNANPESVIAALQVLAAAPGRRSLVLGDLAELGPDGERLHRELGERANRAGIDRLLTCGTLSAHAASSFAGPARHFADRDRLVDALLADLSAEDTVLVKGSRSAAMERVVQRLREAAC